MSSPGNSPKKIRFGDYELELATSELRINGNRVVLQGQPFQILCMLLERPGVLVTREELKKKLWSDGTFVDFDHSLNKAVNRLREALADPAESPGFVETLPRRGYRWIGPIPDDSAAELESEQTVSVPGESTSRARLAFRASRHRRFLLRSVVGIALAMGIGVLAAQWNRDAPRVLRYTQITNDGAEKFNELTVGSIRPPIVSDGSRLYFTEKDANAHAIIAQVATSGGETRVLPTPFLNSGVVSISPSGSDLLVYSWQGNESGIPVWVVHTLGGSVRRVGETTTDATWSPDGQHILFANHNHLQMLGVDGSDLRTLVSVPGAPAWPRWSPAGNTLRFTVHDPKKDTGSIWEVRDDGSHLRSVLPTSNLATACCGNWTPDGRYFVFQSTRNGRSDLWMLRENNRWWNKESDKPVQITAGPMSFYLPVPSTDGKKVFALGVQKRGELMRYNAKSGQFSQYLNGISALDLSYSRDGEWVAYVTYPEGNLWVCKTDATQKMQLTFPPMEAEAPRWSPDSKQIAFMGRNPGGAWRVYLVSPEGHEPKTLVSEDDSQTAPDWSPDGTNVAYGGLPDILSGGLATSNIHIFDFTTQHVSVLQGSQGLYCPRWSPNGRFIAAITVDGRKLKLFDSAIREWTELTKLVQGCPAWSRNGNYVYFQSFDAAGPAFSRVRISDRKQERFASINFRRVQGGHELWWNGMTPDDSLLVLRDEGTQEIYALDIEFP